jgi:hypothetical protein
MSRLNAIQHTERLMDGFQRKDGERRGAQKLQQGPCRPRDGMDGTGHDPMMPNPADGRRRALKLLAGNSNGRTDSALLAHGIHPAVLIGLFNAGLATASVETVRAGRRTIEVTRLQITPEGRKAIGAPAI